jgi:AcrR family transcriptional regulator
MGKRLRAQQRRELLLKAALELFASEGYEGATTKAIAERTGVTEAILFRHFATKRDLFRAVLAESGPGRFVDVDDDALREMPVAAALVRLVTDYLQGMWLNRDWVRVLWQEARQDDQAAAQLRRQYRAIGKALTEVLEAAVGREEIEPDAVPAALQVTSLAIRGFLARSARGPPDDWGAARDGFVHNLVEVVLCGVSAHPCASAQSN